MLPASDLASETRFDRGDGLTRPARIALDEHETVFTFLELRVRTAASLASDIFNWKKKKKKKIYMLAGK